MRVTAACILGFAGLAALVCVVLPYTYSVQSRDRFHQSALDLTEGIARQLQRENAEASVALSGMSDWYAAHPELKAALLLDAHGTELARWPAGAIPWRGALPPMGMFETPDDVVVFQPLEPGVTTESGTVPVLAVRVSSIQLLHDLENARWLFASIFLFTLGVFVVLTRYVSNSILEPLEEIGRAAMSLADGEPVVEVPKTGDREIDELGEFVSRLGANRRHSQVMMIPKGLAKKLSQAGKRAPAAVAEQAPAVSAAEQAPAASAAEQAPAASMAGPMPPIASTPNPTDPNASPAAPPNPTAGTPPPGVAPRRAAPTANPTPVARGDQ